MCATFGKQVAGDVNILQRQTGTVEDGDGTIGGTARPTPRQHIAQRRDLQIGGGMLEFADAARLFGKITEQVAAGKQCRMVIPVCRGRRTPCWRHAFQAGPNRPRTMARVTMSQ